MTEISREERVAGLNTDRELWREREGDYYADSIHVTVGGGIGINVGGRVIVKPLAEWHKLAVEPSPDETALEAARGLLCCSIPDRDSVGRRLYGEEDRQKVLDKIDAAIAALPAPPNLTKDEESV